MLNQHELQRYSRQINLPGMGVEAQEQLKSARVLVVGAGGLGSPVLLYLAAVGVGTLGIVEGDVIDISNLHRQVLYGDTDAGLSKAEMAAARLKHQNPSVAIELHPTFLDAGNALDIIRNYDIVVDGSDNFDTRYLVNDACVILGKPMVSGAIYHFEGQVSVFNYKEGPTYRCLFPQPPGAGESPNCADSGVLATLPGIIGTIQANEVVKIITGIGTVLSGKLLVWDTLSMQSHTFSFAATEAGRNITEIQAPASSSVCATGDVSYVAYDDLLLMMHQEEHVQLVDVREPGEHQQGNIGGMNIPLSQLEQEYNRLDEQQPIVLYCASGKRSLQAAKLLAQHGFARAFTLVGGILHLTLQ